MKPSLRIPVARLPLVFLKIILLTTTLIVGSVSVGLGQVNVPTIAPAQNQVFPNTTTKITFEWQKISGASYYKLVIFNITKSEAHYDNNVGDVNNKEILAFTYGDEYRWVIQAYNSTNTIIGETNPAQLFSIEDNLGACIEFSV